MRSSHSRPRASRLRQHHVALQQRQQVGYLLYALALAVGHHGGLVVQRRKGVVGRAGHGYAALESVGVVIHHAVERIGRAAHGDVPQQVLDVDADGIDTLGLAVEFRTVVALAQHDREVAHGRPPLLCHGVRLGREREGMLAVRVGQSLGQLRHRIVQRDEPHRSRGSSGWSFLFLAATFRSRHSFSCVRYISSSASTSLIHAPTTGSMEPLPEAKSPAM